MASFPFARICRVLLAGAVLAGVGARAQAGKPAPIAVTEPPAPLLPTDAADLHTAATQEKAAGEGDAEILAAEGFPAASPAVLKEDGLTRLASADYGKAKASAFQFGDATGAYSAYTYLRTMMKSPRLSGPEARLGTGSTETTTDAAGSLVWAGTAVLQVHGQLSKDELAALITRLPKVGGNKGLAPLLPTLLAKSGLEPVSLRYALGPAGYAAMGGVLPAELLGWDKSAEAATATYHGKGTFTLLLYPTPQIAGDRGRAIEKAVNDAGGAAKFGMLKMRRLGVLVGVTSGDLSSTQAEELVSGMHVSAVVTFDQKQQPEFHTEVRKTASLLQNIAVLVGVMVVGAILLAMFLGGARAGLRLLQGKSAASEPEFLTISLRDKPKALFAGKDEEAK